MTETWNCGRDRRVLSLLNDYDTDQNWEIGDFELLDLIDFWAAGSYQRDSSGIIKRAVRICSERN